MQCSTSGRREKTSTPSDISTQDSGSLVKNMLMVRKCLIMRVKLKDSVTVFHNLSSFNPLTIKKIGWTFMLLFPIQSNSIALAAIKTAIADMYLQSATISTLLPTVKKNRS